MDNFVVSARKYRPDIFENVVGQTHITTTLKNAIKNNHLAQAFLFCGPRGVGKTTCARILAKTINCTNIAANTEPCGECNSCKSFAQNSSLNIHELDAASNNSVDDMRNLIDQVRYAPQSGKYKIYIIDEVHMLSNQAFNAFLKTLEEPPAHAIFILATTEKHKIIPTILSRCQIFDFNRIQISDTAEHLKKIADSEGIEAEDEALNLIAQKSDGALRDALSIFDLIVTFSNGETLTYKDTIHNLHILDYDYYFKATDFLLEEDLSQTLLLFDDILRQGFDGLNFINGLGEHLRNLLVSRDEATVNLLEVSDAVKAKYIAQAGKASISFLISGLNLVNQCEQQYKNSKNQRLCIELHLMKLAHLNAAFTLSVEPTDIKKKTKVSSPEPAKSSSEPQTKELQTQKSEEPKTEKQEEDKIPEKTTDSPKEETKPKEEQVSESQEEKEVITVEQDNKTVIPQNGIEDNTELKSTSKIPNLNSLMDSIKKPEENENKDPENTATFSIDTLKGAWNKFLDGIDQEENALEYSILKQPLTLNENQVTLTLTNPMQETLLMEFKSDLLMHLRTELNNDLISINTVIKEVEEVTGKKPLYTQHEKFDHLLEKHESVKKLRNKLELDLD